MTKRGLAHALRAAAALAIAGYGSLSPAQSVDLNADTVGKLSANGKALEAPLLSEHRIEAAYAVNSDLNEASSSKLFQNSVQASYSASLLKKFYVTAGFDVRYQAVGNEVVVDNAGPSVGDLSLGAFRMFEVGSRNAFLAYGAVDFPTSPASRREGYSAVGSVLGRLITRVHGNWLRVENSVMGTYVGNRFVVSPTTLETNPDWSGWYLLSVYAVPFRGLRIGTAAGAKATHFLDGTSTVGFSNSQFLRYDVQSWTFQLAWTHGDWIDRQSIDFWYIDRYRQLVTARVLHAF